MESQRRPAGMFLIVPMYEYIRLTKVTIINFLTNISSLIKKNTLELMD